MDNLTFKAIWESTYFSTRHFQKRPMEVESIDANHYLIVPKSFIEFQEPKIQVLKKYGKTQYVYSHAIKIRLGNLYRKMKHLLKRI